MRLLFTFAAGALCAGLLISPRPALARVETVPAQQQPPPPNLPPPQPGPIEQVIRNIFQIFFPASTFVEAVEGAGSKIFSEFTRALREPMIAIVRDYAFSAKVIFGTPGLVGPVDEMGRVMTAAATPLWALSLAFLALAALTRQATGVGYGSNDVAQTGAQWLFIALASGNGLPIVNFVHNAFDGLAMDIAGIGAMGAAELVNGFLVPDHLLSHVSFILLTVTTCIALITILVMGITQIARQVMLFAVAGLAPVCIACEGIPFTRFVFRDWLGMFLRLEILQILNVFVLALFAKFGNTAVNGDGPFSALASIIVMVGFCSVIIGLNLQVFKGVFGLAMDTASGISGAVMSVVGFVGAAGLMATGVGAPAAAGAGSIAAGGASASASSSAGGASSGATSAPVKRLSLPSPSAEAASTSSSGGAGAANAETEQSEDGDGGSESSVAAWGAAGAVASGVGSAIGSNTLRSFGRGAVGGAVWKSQVKAAKRQDERDQESKSEQAGRRAESLAYQTGAASPTDRAQIASELTSPQAFDAYADAAPTTKAMARAFGGPERAAAAAGYDNFADLAHDFAQDRMSGGRADSPISQQLAQPPDRDAVDHIQPWDFYAGWAVAQRTGASPANAPKWAETAFSMRQSDGGAERAQALLAQTSAGPMTERQAMQWVDASVAQSPPIAGAPPVYRFWDTSSKPKSRGGRP